MYLRNFGNIFRKIEDIEKQNNAKQFYEFLLKISGKILRSFSENIFEEIIRI